jgi:hypothetical protein
MRDRLQSLRFADTLPVLRPSESVPRVFHFLLGNISHSSNSRRMAKPWSYLVATLGLRFLDPKRPLRVRYNDRWMALENLSAGGVR